VQLLGVYILKLTSWLDR